MGIIKAEMQGRKMLFFYFETADAGVFFGCKAISAALKGKSVRR